MVAYSALVDVEGPGVSSLLVISKVVGSLLEVFCVKKGSVLKIQF